MKNKITSYLQPITLLKTLAAVCVLLAIAAVLFMAQAPRELRVTYLAKNVLASNASTTFAPAVRHLMDVPLQWVLIALLLVAALYAALQAFKYRRGYEDNLKGKTSFRRWVYLAVSGVLSADIVALLCGLEGIGTIKPRT